MEDKPQRNPCGLLHQLQAWRLLQCGKWVVCLGGLNAGLNALVFDFEELPLWNMVTAGVATRDPSMKEVDLCSMKPKAISTTLVPHLFSTIKPQPNITKTLNLHIQGALDRLQWTFPTTSIPIFQHSTPRRKLPLVALGAPPTMGAEDPLGLERADLATPKPLATSSWVLQHMAMPEDIPTTVPISHSPSPTPASQTLTAASIPSTPWSGTHPRAGPGILSEEVLQLQREMNVGMGQLLTTKASMDSCQRKLLSNTKTACVKMRPRPPRPSMRWRPTAQPQSRMQSLCVQSLSGRQRLPGQVMPIPCNNPLVKYTRLGAWDPIERWVGLPIFSRGFQSSLTRLSPQSLWGTHVPLAVADWEYVPGQPFGDHLPTGHCYQGTHPHNTASDHVRDTCTPTGTQWQCCSSNQEAASLRSGEEEATVLEVTPEEQPHQWWKNRRHLAKLPKESHWEAFSKDSKIIKAARWAYHPSHKGMFVQEGSYDLMSVFQEMATSTGLLDSDVHEVQNEWTGWKDLWATHQVAKSSPKDIHFFQLVPPTESPKIMGLNGIHSPRP